MYIIDFQIALGAIVARAPKDSYKLSKINLLSLWFPIEKKHKTNVCQNFMINCSPLLGPHWQISTSSAIVPVVQSNTHWLDKRGSPTAINPGATAPHWDERGHSSTLFPIWSGILLSVRLGPFKTIKWIEADLSDFRAWFTTRN